MTKSKLVFFPRLSLDFLLISLIVLVAVCIVLDSVVIPKLEDLGNLSSRGWEEEDRLLYWAGNAKNLATLRYCPVWQSKGWPVSEKSSKEHRILVIGDSFVWGHGYSNFNDIWWRQLARELQRRGYDQVEVIAAGIQGINTRLELDVAKEVIPKYHPDLVIFGYVTNDTDEESGLTVQYFDPKLSFTPRRLTGINAFEVLFPNLSYQLFKLRGAKNSDADAVEFAGDKMRNLKGANWSAYCKTVKAAGEYLNSLSIPSFILTTPHDCPGHKVDFEQIRLLHDRLYPPVKQLFERNKIRFISGLDDWIEAAKGEPRLVSRGVLWFGINPANSHPNSWAAHAYAKKAADVLEHDYPQCLGPKAVKSARGPLRLNDWMPPNLQVQQAGNNVVFVYPFQKDFDSLRYMPIRKPFIQLSFENSVAAREIILCGKGLTDASLYLTKVDEQKNFDDGDLIALGRKRGRTLSWKLAPSLQNGISTINLNANFGGKDRVLLLQLKP